MAGGARDLSRVCFIPVLIPFMRTWPSRTNHLPRAPTPNTITLGGRFPHGNLGDRFDHSTYPHRYSAEGLAMKTEGSQLTHQTAADVKELQTLPSVSPVQELSLHVGMNNAGHGNWKSKRYKSWNDERLLKVTHPRPAVLEPGSSTTAKADSSLCILTITSKECFRVCKQYLHIWLISPS